LIDALPVGTIFTHWYLPGECDRWSNFIDSFSLFMVVNIREEEDEMDYADR